MCRRYHNRTLPPFKKKKKNAPHLGVTPDIAELSCVRIKRVEHAVYTHVLIRYCMVYV